MGLTFAELSDTPLGQISFIAGDRGLQRVSFSSLVDLRNCLGIFDSATSLNGLGTVGVLLSEINAYFSGIQHSFSVEIDWSHFSGFQYDVLRSTSQIPFGKYATYGDVAQIIGHPGAARAVGSALRSNPMPVVIPCHRVVGSDHSLRGYSGGLDKKAFLLRLEGHKIEAYRIMAE